MPKKTFDVVIIGGGVVGAALARHVSRYRVSAALLEKEEELAFGVSKSNSGIIHPGTQNHPDSLKGKLCVRGNRLTRFIARELGVTYTQVGELIIAFTDEEIAELARIKENARALGVPGMRIVGKGWLAEHEPQVSKEAAAALYVPTAGIISPYRLVYAMAESAAANGVEMHTRTCVQGIIKNASGFEIQTSQGVYYSRFVVNAAGVSADTISALAGINNFTITPRKGEEFLLDKKCQGITNHLIFPVPTPVSKGILIIKTSDGNPMIGPTAVDVRDKYDTTTSEEGLRVVVSAAQKLVPAIQGKDIIAYFAGVRPVAGNDFIIRHENTVSGFINVAGMQSPGLTAAPAIAVYVADILRSHGLRMRRKLYGMKKRIEPAHIGSLPLKHAQTLIQADPAYGDIVCRCEMVSAKEITHAIAQGARTLDGIKFRTRCQAGRCHGSFCTVRAMKILAEQTGQALADISKRGAGSEVIKSPVQ